MLYYFLWRLDKCTQTIFHYSSLYGTRLRWHPDKGISKMWYLSPKGTRSRLGVLFGSGRQRHWSNGPEYETLWKKAPFVHIGSCCSTPTRETRTVSSSMCTRRHFLIKWLGKYVLLTLRNTYLYHSSLCVLFREYNARGSWNVKVQPFHDVGWGILLSNTGKLG